jgi:hypothetical protein
VLLIWRDVDANHRHVSCSFPPSRLCVVSSSFSSQRTKAIKPVFYLLSPHWPSLGLLLFSPSWIRKIYLAFTCVACFLKTLELPLLYTSHFPHLTSSRALFRLPSRLWPLRRYIPRILLAIRCILSLKVCIYLLMFPSQLTTPVGALVDPVAPFPLTQSRLAPRYVAMRYLCTC